MSRRTLELMPLKAELVFDNKRGEAYAKPRIEHTTTFKNKGRDKQWYIDRANREGYVLNWN